MPLSDAENATVRWAAGLACVASAGGNLLLLQHTHSFGSRANDGSRFRLRTIFFISITNLGQCIGFALGNTPVHVLGHIGCVGQALLLQFCGLSTVLWTLVLSNGALSRDRFWVAIPCYLYGGAELGSIPEPHRSLEVHG